MRSKFNNGMTSYWSIQQVDLKGFFSFQRAVYVYVICTYLLPLFFCILTRILFNQATIIKHATRYLEAQRETKVPRWHVFYTIHYFVNSIRLHIDRYNVVSMYLISLRSWAILSTDNSTLSCLHSIVQIVCIFLLLYKEKNTLM